ncbi:MAG: ATP-binding cassette, subfamily multidrug efflux pump, partial [Chloroflexia bacterium]|nr:ATP-binding cassette, subfamily multidrug efflux pump [Chloroflexia bacterium]
MSAAPRSNNGGPPAGSPPARPMGGPMRGGMMGMPVQKAKDFKGTAKRLLGYMRPYRLQLLIVLLTAVLSTLFTIVGPKIMGEATTKLFEGLIAKAQGVPGAAIDFAGIANILLILVVLYLISSAFSYLQQYVMAGVAQRTVYDMRRDVDNKLARLPLKFFDARTHGEILSRVTNDVDNISNTLQQSVTQLMTSVITILGVMIMMFTINVWMTLIAIVAVPLSLAIAAFIGTRSQKYFVNQQRTLGQLNGHVEEMYTGHKIVKVFGREEDSVRKFNEYNEKLYDVGWRAQFISGLIMPLLSFVNNIAYVAVAVIGGIMVTQRGITIGDVQAFIQYMRQFSWPIMQTAQIANILQLAVASAERVFEVLDEQEEVPDSAQPRVVQFPRGAVQFEHVDFSYKADAPLIEDMNIDVKPGQTVAIVGPTGAGKTTLVNLLMRFYELDAGRITVDGVNITDMKRRDLRSIFGMVLQDTWLFNGTISDNIAYGRPGANMEDIVEAARTAHADHFIRTLPDGYDTVLNEEASNISQGQKQLLAIARAVLADPAILILDEATSSVDTRTEVLIQKAMEALMSGRTSFVIAHRLSTIRNASLILVMNNGSVIEKGTHSELLAAGGFYAELYNSQFTGGAPQDTSG